MSRREDTREASIGDLLSSLKERAKELNCLYAVEEAMHAPDADPPSVCRAIIKAIPPGWQYPGICQAMISLGGLTYRSSDYLETPWKQEAEVRVQDKMVGTITISYRRKMPDASDGPFLSEEVRLIQTIANRLGGFVHHYAIKEHFKEWETARENQDRPSSGDWRIILDLLSHTDANLFQKTAHKMLNHLCWSGIQSAEQLLQQADIHRKAEDDALDGDSNRPHLKARTPFTEEIATQTFAIASEHLSDEEILFRIQKWMQEDKIGFLVRAVERNQSLPDVADAIQRFHHITSQESELSGPLRSGVRVSLIRRFLSDQLPYIKVAKEYMGINDFHQLLRRVIYAGDSQGRLGGKAAGLYLAAMIIRKHAADIPELADVRIPLTWHITSDMHLDFMHYNNLDEIVEQKYKQPSQIRFEYPHIVHLCKNSGFPAAFINGLSVALDDFGDRPLIVRSSSVLEDRVGAAFSGKYKSLFVANQGNKTARLEALLDAVAEVYASMFGPDPIQYRVERGLIDFAEEMGIMIQEVVGTRVGKYYFPAFAGVAFSRNEYRWSPRIRSEDGLVRLVPGLGTRAVDRLGDDYPIMFAPGQPALRVNASTEELLRYCPRFADVINLEKNTFETVRLEDLVDECGEELPLINKLFGRHEDGNVRRLSPVQDLPRGDDLVCDFEGLMSERLFVRQMQQMVTVLEAQLGMPVDVEFAHDGKHLHLLQCRSQSQEEETAPVPIPADIPDSQTIFTARRFVSNGAISGLTHIVYVDADGYSALPEHKDLKDVGRAVGQLNRILPKRQFILIGPGRWGSRGDVKLGVPITYSDINNTTMLIEVARTKGNYTPDLSFGTHFFQDLVEARIRYLPLYPDEEGNIFNEHFLMTSPNVLGELLPEYERLSDVIRVIDVPKTCDGRHLLVLMNAEIDQAIAYLADPDTAPAGGTSADQVVIRYSDTHWRWRLGMATELAAQLDGERFGVAGIYVFGSTKNATARAASDIDLIVHFCGDDDQRARLAAWLEGWSLSLDELNHQRTGYRAGGLLDVHYVTDADIRNRTSYAVKIGAVTDAARPLKLKAAAESEELADS